MSGDPPRTLRNDRLGHRSRYVGRVEIEQCLRAITPVYQLKRGTALDLNAAQPEVRRLHPINPGPDRN
jgi:hypothetical protein